MNMTIRKKFAVAASFILAVGMIPVPAVRESDAANKKYTVSNKSGTYTDEATTTVTANAGYKVYYTLNGKFTLAKVIKSGKSKTFTIKKDSTLQVVAVKKNAKVTRKKLIKKLAAKAKAYDYDIESSSGSSDTGSTGSGTDSGTANTTAAPQTSPAPVAPSGSMTPGASGAPGASMAPGASGAPTGGNSSSGGSGSGMQGGPGGNMGGMGGMNQTSNTVSGLSAISADTTKPAALTYDSSSATKVTLTGDYDITSAGTYIFSSNSSVSGVIKVKKNLGNVTIVLNGVNITSAKDGDNGVIEVAGGNTVNVIVAAGSANTITSTGAGEAETDDSGNATGETDYPACILVKKTSTIKIGGTGTLNLKSTNGSGIKVKFNECSTSGDIDTTCPSLSAFWDTTLTIQDNLTINITCNEYDNKYKSTANYDGHQDAISSKNSLAIYGGRITIAAGDDGIHAEARSHIVGGTITVSSSTEALEGAQVVVDGGTLDLTASDDGINAANGDITTNTQTGEDVNIFNITINGGTVTVNSEGDGIDSNGNAFITGGTVRVNGPTSGGNGALDVADGTGCFLVSGGTLAATAGTSDMAISPSTNGLGFVAASLGSAVSAGTTLTIKDSSGNSVGTVKVTKSTSWILYSGSGITNGNTYTVTNGSTTLATVTAGQGASGGMGGMPGGMNGQGGGPMGFNNQSGSSDASGGFGGGPGNTGNSSGGRGDFPGGSGPMGGGPSMMTV